MLSRRSQPCLVGVLGLPGARCALVVYWRAPSRASRPNRRVLGLPAESRLRRTPDRLRGDQTLRRCSWACSARGRAELNIHLGTPKPRRFQDRYRRYRSTLSSEPSSSRRRTTSSAGRSSSNSGSSSLSAPSIAFRMRRSLPYSERRRSLRSERTRSACCLPRSADRATFRRLGTFSNGGERVGVSAP
jgi:hypothetical protein